MTCEGAVLPRGESGGGWSFNHVAAGLSPDYFLGVWHAVRVFHTSTVDPHPHAAAKITTLKEGCSLSLHTPWGHGMQQLDTDLLEAARILTTTLKEGCSLALRTQSLASYSTGSVRWQWESVNWLSSLTTLTRGVSIPVPDPWYMWTRSRKLLSEPPGKTDSSSRIHSNPLRSVCKSTEPPRRWNRYNM